MIGYLVIALLLVLLVWFFYTDLTLFLKIWIFASISIQFILSKLRFGFSSLSFVFLFLVIALLIMFKFRQMLRAKEFVILLFLQILFLIFLLFSSSFRGDLDYMFDFTKFYFFGLFFIPLILYSSHTFSLISLNRFIFIFTFLLSLIGILQFLFPVTESLFYVDLSELGYNQTDNIAAFSRVSGISLRPSHYGNLLAVLLIYCIGTGNSLIVVSKFFFRILVIFGILALVFTGVKTSIASFIFGFVLLALMRRSSTFLLYLVIGGICMALFWNVIVEIGVNYSAKDGFSNAIGRSFRFFAILDSDSLGDDSTVSLTMMSLGHFVSAPFFGSAATMTWLRDLSITDAYLIYHFIQFGIIGMTILLYPYFRFIFAMESRENFVLLFTLILVILLQTITDPGLFHIPTNLVLCCFIAIRLKNLSFDGTK